MNKKWMLVFMVGFTLCLGFITLSSLLPGCAAQTPSTTTYVLTSTVTKTPTP